MNSVNQATLQVAHVVSSEKPKSHQKCMVRVHFHIPVEDLEQVDKRRERRHRSRAKQLRRMIKTVLVRKDLDN